MIPPTPPVQQQQQQQQQIQPSPQFQQQMAQAASAANDPQLSALHFHLQREQAFNMIRNGARFFDPRFNLSSNF